MKKSLLFILFLIFTLTLQAQKDTINVIGALPQKDISRDALNVNVSIYPVPVRENSFTLKLTRISHL